VFDHRIGDSDGTSVLHISFTQRAEGIELESSVFPRFQANADTIAWNSIPDTQHQRAHNIPEILVGDGLVGHFEEQFEASLFAL
jgi:hypothetical protein